MNRLRVNFGAVAGAFVVIAAAGVTAGCGTGHPADVSSAPASASAPGPSVAPAVTPSAAAPSPSPSYSPVAPAVPGPPPTVAQNPPAASCYPLTSGGNCYEPGEYCRKSDHGASGVAGDGKSIVCENNDGWRWEPA